MTTSQDITLEQAAVVGNSLLGFGKGMSAEERQAVRNTFQLATLVADKCFDQQTQAEAWFRKLVSVMVDTNWVNLTSQYGRRMDATHSLKVANVLIDVVQAAVATAVAGTPIGAVLTTMAGDVIQALPKTGEAFNLFKRKSHTDKGVRAGVASCAKTPEGEIILAMGVVDLVMAKHDVDVFFFDWSSDDATITNASVVLSATPGEMAKQSETVELALGKRAEENIKVYLDLLNA
jgi:hypothetical protein